MSLKSTLLLTLSLTALLTLTRQGMAQATADEPSKDEFIEVEKEPTPITSIGSLVHYPEDARRAGLEGRVLIDALIDKDGTVKKAEISNSSSDIHPQGRLTEGERTAPKILEDEAVRAVMSVQFTPAMQNGKPIKVWMTIPITFKLTDPPTNTAAQQAPDTAAEEFVYVTEEPRPLQSISAAVQYPEEAKRLGLEGDVKARILVEKDGSVSKVIIDDSPAPVFSTEATRVLKLTKFIPAQDQGKPVRVWMQQKVQFRLH